MMSQPQALASAGFAELARESEGEYPFTRGWSWTSKKHVIMRALAAGYRLRAFRAPNRETVQKNVLQVFRARPEETGAD